MSNSLSWKSILKHFLNIGVGSIANLVIGFFTVPILTRIVSPEEYGLLSLFTTYASLITAFLYLGQDQSLVRFFYDHEDALYEKSLFLKCVSVPLFLAILLLTVSYVASVFRFFDWNKLVLLFFVYAILEILERFLLLLHRLLYKSRQYSAITIFRKLCYLTLATIILWFTNQKTGETLIAAVTIASFLSVVACIFSLKDFLLAPMKNSIPMLPHRELIQYGFPFVFSTAIGSLFTSCDKIALNYFGNQGDVGIYASAWTIVNAFSIMQTIFCTLWVPMAVEHHAKDEEDRSFYERGNRIITIIMFSAGIMAIGLKDVCTLLLGEKYRSAAQIIPFLIFSPIMYTVSETTMLGIIFRKKNGAQIFISLGACITNIIGNYILVPLYGCKGAAISTGISYIIFFTLRTVFSVRLYYTNYKLKSFYCLTIIALLYCTYSTFGTSVFWNIIGCVVCLGAVFFLYREDVIYVIQFLVKILKNHSGELNA